LQECALDLGLPTAAAPRRNFFQRRHFHRPIEAIGDASPAPDHAASHSLLAP
jgi:hypothetical protein